MVRSLGDSLPPHECYDGAYGSALVFDDGSYLAHVQIDQTDYMGEPVSVTAWSTPHTFDSHMLRSLQRHARRQQLGDLLVMSDDPAVPGKTVGIYDPDAEVDPGMVIAETSGPGVVVHWNDARLATIGRSVVQRNLGRNEMAIISGSSHEQCHQIIPLIKDTADFVCRRALPQAMSCLQSRVRLQQTVPVTPIEY